MLLAIFKDKPPYRKFLILVSVVLFSTIIFSLAGALLINNLYGVDLLTNPDALNDLSNPAVLAAMKFLQVLTSGLGMFIIPAFLVAMLFNEQPLNYLGLKHQPAAVSYALTFLLMVMAVPFINALLAVNQSMELPGFLSGIEAWIKEKEAAAAVITEAFLKMENPGDLIQNLFIIAVIPAIGEELLFRGLVQRLFTEMTGKVVLSIIISAALFSALHMQFYGFIPRMALGVLFGFLYVWSGSIWLPIFAHLINNGAAVVLTYMNQNQDLPFDEETIGTTAADWPFLLVSLLAVIVTCVVLFRVETTRRSSRREEEPA